MMYCMAGQSSEEEMYNNESAGQALEEFLHLLGERVRLKGFTKYRAQLDTKSMYMLSMCNVRSKRNTRIEFVISNVKESILVLFHYFAISVCNSSHASLQNVLKCCI